MAEVGGEASGLGGSERRPGPRDRCLDAHILRPIPSAVWVCCPPGALMERDKWDLPDGCGLRAAGKPARLCHLFFSGRFSKVHAT